MNYRGTFLSYELLLDHNHTVHNEDGKISRQDNEKHCGSIRSAPIPEMAVLEHIGASNDTAVRDQVELLLYADLCETTAAPRVHEEEAGFSLTSSPYSTLKAESTAASSSGANTIPQSWLEGLTLRTDPKVRYPEDQQLRPESVAEASHCSSPSLDIDHETPSTRTASEDHRTKSM